MADKKESKNKCRSIFLVYSLALLVIYSMIQGAGVAVNYNYICLQEDSFVYEPLSYNSTPKFKAEQN